MSISATALRELMALGVEGEKLLEIVTIFERDADRTNQRDEIVTPRTKAAQRAKNYRDRKRDESVTIVTETVTLDERDGTPPAPPSSSSPLTLPLLTTPPSPPPKKNNIISDWPDDYRDRFWKSYPRKTEKKSAFSKLDAIYKSGKVSWAVFSAGVKRYVDQIARNRTEEQYVKHPTVWLNKGCWDDEPSQLRQANPDDEYLAGRL